MKKILLGFYLIVAFLLANAQTSASFSEPHFNDTSRLARIKNTFPLLEAYIQQFSTKHHIPGYAFGIVVDGELVFKGAGGYANMEDSLLASTATMFRIASMSKSFTSLAILKLRDEGKLTLDDAIEKYIPSMKGQRLTLDAAPITIRQLMSHSAGFPEDNPWGDRQLEDTEADLLKLIQKGISFSNAPGLHYEYSNLGFALLGYIIHQVSGLPYHIYIQKNILSPIGMKETTYEYSSVPKNKLAKGYRYIDEQWKNEKLLHDGIYGAMGGMITSIDMFSKYVSLHLSAWPERNDNAISIAKRSTIREMHQPVQFVSLNSNFTYASGRKIAMSDNYSYGLHVYKDALNRTAVAHSGGLPGFGSNWRIMPEYGIGVMYFANRTYAPASVLNTSLLDTIVQLAQLKPRQISVSPILKKRQKELVETLTQWNIVPPIFADNFFDDYSLISLKKESEEIFEKVGSIKKVGEMIAENQLRGYCIIECERKNLRLFFTLTPESPALIQEYNLTIE